MFVKLEVLYAAISCCVRLGCIVLRSSGSGVLGRQYCIWF